MRKAVFFVVALAMVAALWELYKLVIPDDGIHVGETLILPRSDDDLYAAPLGDPSRPSASRRSPGSSGTVALLGGGPRSGTRCAGGRRASRSASSSASCSRWPMQRLRIVERALLPYVVLSQTVPLIALAPLVLRLERGT